MKKIVGFVAFALCLGILPVSAHADTLTLVSTGGASVNGVAIYPYNFSLNGAPSLIDLVCLNFNREITYGETWQVTRSSIALDDSQVSTNYRALALIDYALKTGYGGYSASDLQFADWSIFDPSDMANNSGFNSSAASIKQTALQMAGDTSLTNSGFYSAFTLYRPTDDQTGWTNGIPQEFLGYGDAAPVPEPSTLLFFGTGLIGAAGAARRRFATPRVAR